MRSVTRSLRAVVQRRLPTLQGRLTAALVVLVLVVTALTAVTTALVLRSALLSQLDSQLAGAGGRYSAEVDRGGGDDAGGGGGAQGQQQGQQQLGGGRGGADPDRGVGRGQGVGTLGVIVRDGAVVQASVVDRDGTTATATLDDGAAATLTALRSGAGPSSVDLGELGDYRVSAITHDGSTQVTGLPLAAVHAVLGRVVLGEVALGLLAAAAGGVVTALVVRRGLRPLRDVTTTALGITELPLAGSADGLPGPVTTAGATAEVRRVSTAVDAMVEHVRAALQVRDAEEERRRRFMADASHELRTPLAVVQAHTEQALRSGQGEGVRPALERIAVASGRMGHLVDDLLLLSHLDAGRPLASQPVALSLLVLEELVDARAAGPDHGWEAALPEEPVDVQGDPQRLHQVLTGLLTNARRHTPAGTTVTVTVRTTDSEVDEGVPSERGAGRGWVELDVADDGPGVPDDLRERVFERFTRADAARSGGGSGLGLAIARGIALAHGGDLLLLPTPRGATFRLRLPVDPTPAS